MLKFQSIYIHCLECFNPRRYFFFFIIWVAMVNYLNIHVINWAYVFKIKKWGIIFSCISPRTRWLYKFTTDLYWLNLSLNLVTVVSRYWLPHTVQDIKYITLPLLRLIRKFYLCFFFVKKLLNSFPGTNILQTFYLLELHLKLPVATSGSAFNVDLTNNLLKT